MKYYNLTLRIADDKNNLFPKLNYKGNHTELQKLRSQYSFSSITNSIIPIETDIVYDQDSENTQINDMLNWMGVLDTQYEVVSLKLKELLEKHQLGQYSFRPVQVHSDNGKLNYFIFQTLNNAVNLLDFGQSLFTEWKSLKREKVHANDIFLKDVSEFNNTRKTLRKQKLQLGLHKLVLKRHLDWFQVPVLGHVVSEPLLAKLLDNQITGIIYRPIENIEIEVKI